MMRKLTFILAILVAAPLLAQAVDTPDVLWANLMRGNDQFAAGGNLTINVGRAPYGSQSPKVSVLSCSDSRVPPELVFKQSIGDLFVVRAAGNIADSFGVASLEYALAGVNPRWTKLIVVLAHQNCGAVEAALKTNQDGSLTPDLLALVTRIRQSFVGIEKWKYDDPVILDQAIKANARYSAARLIADSAVIRKAVQEEGVGLIVAYYRLDTGKVERIRF